MGDHIRVGQVSAEEVREAALAMKRQAEAMLTAVQPFVAALNGNGIMMLPQFIPQSTIYQSEIPPNNAAGHYLPLADGASITHHGGIQTLDGGPHHLHTISNFIDPNAPEAPASDLDASIDPCLRQLPRTVESMNMRPTFEPGSMQPYIGTPSLSTPPTRPVAPWQMAPWHHPSSQPLPHPAMYPHLPQALAPPVHHVHPTTPAPGRALGSNAPRRLPRSLQLITKAVIPKLPRGANAWRLAVEQWEKVNSDTDRALKDWPDEWYKGDMGPFNGAKYGQRRMVALEFIDT